MTENKRFTLQESTIYNQKEVICDNGIELPQSTACDLLNELHDGNLHLNYDNKRLVKFILSKGYDLKDYLDFCKEYEK